MFTRASKTCLVNIRERFKFKRTRFPFKIISPFCVSTSFSSKRGFSRSIGGIWMLMTQGKLVVSISNQRNEHKEEKERRTKRRILFQMRTTFELDDPRGIRNQTRKRVEMGCIKYCFDQTHQKGRDCADSNRIYLLHRWHLHLLLSPRKYFSWRKY